MKKMLVFKCAAIALLASAALIDTTLGETTLKNTFTITSWDETTYLELENEAKHTNAKVRKSYSGVLEGQGQLEYLMAYSSPSAAYFTGLEHFAGTVGGKSGTLTIAHQGVFKGGEVDSNFHIVDGSQTGELIGVTGEGRYTSGHSMVVEFDFTHLLAEAP